MVHLVVTVAAALALTTAALAKSTKPFVSTYWPAYHSYLQPPSKIPYAKLTNIDWFVAAPTENGTLVQAGAGPTFEPLDVKTITDIVSRAHKNKVTVTLSIGGWTGSRYFSSLIKTPDSRRKLATTFAKTCRDLSFDGISIDWEFPGTQGSGCNQVDPTNDIENYLLFLVELRKQVGKTVRISSAVPASGYDAFKGDQSKRLAAALTDITIMAYDYNGPGWSPVTAPNAPLRVCKAEVQSLSVEAAIDLWMRLGFARSQLILGMPTYGYGYKQVKSLPKGKSDDGSPTSLYGNFAGAIGGETADRGKDICGVDGGDGGQWLYQELITKKYIDAKGKKGINGWTRYWDACSETPYIYSPSKQLLIAYDDVQSITAKAKLAKRRGLLGITYFDSTGDYRDQLLDAGRSGIGAC